MATAGFPLPFEKVSEHLVTGSFLTVPRRKDPSRRSKNMKTPSRRSTHKLVISSALAIILCCAGDIAGAQAAGAKTPGATSQPDSSSSVVLVGEKTLVLDPACNACMGAMLPLILQYPARTGATRPVALLARTADPSLQAGVGAPAPGSLELQLHSLPATIWPIR